MTLNNVKRESPVHEWSADIPCMIEETVIGYKNFVVANATMVDTAKSFRDYHMACRSALAHLEQLIKLYNWTKSGTEPSAGTDEYLDQLIVRAQSALESGQSDNEEYI